MCLCGPKQAGELRGFFQRVFGPGAHVLHTSQDWGKLNALLSFEKKFKAGEMAQRVKSLPSLMPGADMIEAENIKYAPQHTPSPR